MIHLPKASGSWLHPSFLELQAFLGSQFNPSYCDPDDAKAIKDREKFNGTDEEWAASTHIFSYANIGLATAGIHRPYLARLLDHTADRWGATIIDYGAGGGQVGIGLHFLGYNVSFADVPSQSLSWLMFRLRALKLDLPIYMIDKDIEIPKHDVAICFDVMEHIPPKYHEATLERLAKIGSIVFVNLIRNEGKLPGIHCDVDIEGLTAFVKERWGCHFEDHYPDEDGVPRQRLLIYGNVTHL